MKVARLVAASLLLALPIASCDPPGGDDDPRRGARSPAGSPREASMPLATPSETFPPEPMEGGGLEAPPPVTIRYFDDAIALHAWTYCYRSGCVDGAPPADPPDVGDPAEILVEFPLRGWDFHASLTPSGEKCGRVQRTALEQRDDGMFVLHPAGHVDTYDVTLEGRGAGDLFTTFRWTTPSQGRLPNPRARLAIIAGDQEEVLSYGLELSLTNLAATPERARATITVTASDGGSLEIDAAGRNRGCRPEGTVYWDAPDDKALEAARLGDPPFTYEVELMLDGERYDATATWPDDVIKGFAPSVRLHFDPPLPALD